MEMVPIETDIIIALATLAAIMALVSCVAGWVDRRWPIGAILVLAAAVGLLTYVHLALREGGLTFWAIPDAFIAVAAKLL